MSKVLNLDHYGRGIVKENGKVTFISNTLKDEEIEYKVVEDKKKYCVGEVTKYLNKSSKRVNSPCPYFNICGGCALQHMSYEETLEFKKDKVANILERYASLKPDIDIIKNDNPYNYRNKVSLKVVNGKIGFYKINSHDLVQIDKCLLAEEAINKFINDINLVNIKNGDITIRTNYNAELLIIINTSDELKIDIKTLKKHHKIVGIVLNNKLIDGEDKFIEIINNHLFQVSYNSFFQINRNVTAKIFDIVKENIDSDAIVADMFCGVGTLGLMAATNAQKVYGIEVVDNAIKNALINKKINKKDNIEFMLGDANKLVFKISDKINTIIVDPPRSGLSKAGIDSILKICPKDIIYISCDPMTLARDLNVLKNEYEITKFYIADMFSYTYHVESICILKKK